MLLVQNREQTEVAFKPQIHDCQPLHSNKVLNDHVASQAYVHPPPHTPGQGWVDQPAVVRHNDMQPVASSNKATPGQQLAAMLKAIPAADLSKSIKKASPITSADQESEKPGIAPLSDFFVPSVDSSQSGADPCDRLRLIWIDDCCFRQKGNHTRHWLERTFGQVRPLKLFKKGDRFGKWLERAASVVGADEFCVLTNWKEAKPAIEAFVSVKQKWHKDGYFRIVENKGSRNSGKKIGFPDVSLFIIVCSDGMKSFLNALKWCDKINSRDPAERSLVTPEILVVRDMETAHDVMVLWRAKVYGERLTKSVTSHLHCNIAPGKNKIPMVRIAPTIL